MEESERLLEFVLSKSLELKIDRLEILGDLADTHSILRLEVLEFWQKWFNILYENKIETFVLRGNHDVGGSYENEYTWLEAFKHLNSYINIITEPTVSQGFGYLPYIHNNQEFIEEANHLINQGANVLVSHTSYEGASYDNGCPITGAVSADLIDSRFLHMISGHIHTEFEMGRVWYPGTARWLTKSCSNKRKGIWLCTHDDTGLITSKEFISTEFVCTPIVSLVWNEGEPKPDIMKGTTTNIELVGSSDWVTEQKKELKGVSISSKITDIKKSKIRKSGRSLHDFLSNHYQAEPEKRQKLIKYLGDLNLV